MHKQNETSDILRSIHTNNPPYAHDVLVSGIKSNRSISDEDKEVIEYYNDPDNRNPPSSSQVGKRFGKSKSAAYKQIKKLENYLIK
jgi:hypothetical protein